MQYGCEQVINHSGLRMLYTQRMDSVMWQITFEFNDGSLMSFRSSRLNVEETIVSWYDLYSDECPSADDIRKISAVYVNE